MASKSIRKQFTVLALFEGYCNCIIDQAEEPSDQFLALRERVIGLSCEITELLRKEPNGVITKNDLIRIGNEVEKLKQACFVDGADAKHVSTMLINLIDEIITHVKGERKGLFILLSQEAENLWVCFDPECSYEGDEGFRASLIFDSLEI